jgi:hypothetical protein
VARQRAADGGDGGTRTPRRDDEVARFAFRTEPVTAPGRERIPGRVLTHAIVGREPNPRILAAAVLVGVVLAAAVLGVERSEPFTRMVAALLALDVGAGLVSNASRSTRSYWAERSRVARLTFLVVHLSVYPAALVLLVGEAWLQWLLIGALCIKTALFATGARRVG